MAAITGFHSNLHRVLAVGLGAGSAPHYLQTYHGVTCDVIELSSDVVELAEDYFYFTPKGSTTIGDGRELILQRAAMAPAVLQAAGRYDGIVHDVFCGHTAASMYTRDVFAAIRDYWLEPESGVLLVNFIGFIKGEHYKASLAIAVTLRRVFNHVKCYRDSPLEENSEEASNIACFASSKPLVYRKPYGDKFNDPAYMSSFWVMINFVEWETLTAADVAGFLKEEQDAEKRNLLLSPENGSLIESVSLAATVATRSVNAMTRDYLPDFVWDNVRLHEEKVMQQSINDGSFSDDEL